jgi:hypothetical protein
MHTRLGWIASLVLLAASAAAQEIYRYTDEHGRAHYTDSYYEVPERYRDQIADLAGEVEGPGSRLSVLPGFMAPPEPAQGKGGKGKAGARQAKAGSDFQEGFARGFSAVTGKSPGAFSPGLLIFAALLGLLVCLALGGGLLMTACNIVGERPVALGHAMLIVLIQGIAGALASGALNLTLAIAGQPGPTLMLVGALGGFTATTVVNAAVLKQLHCEGWGSAFKVTFAVMILGLLLAAPLIYCAIR